MAVTRKQLVTGLSVIYLLGLTILAGYALHSTNAYRLPIPNALCALTVALPALAGIALETVLTFNERLAAKGQLQASRVFQVTVAFFLILESVLATLAGAHHSPPGSLNCALSDKWHNLYSKEDAKAIRTIQDAFSCCGFNSPRDMSWPFADSSANGAEACSIRYERDARCLEPWRNEERKVAIMLLVVSIAVFVWKIAILLAPSSRSSWLPSHIRLPSDTSQGSSVAPRKARAAIGYRDLEEEGGSAQRETSVQREVNGLNKHAQLAKDVEIQRTKSASKLLDGRNVWREEEVEQDRANPDRRDRQYDET